MNTQTIVALLMLFLSYQTPAAQLACSATYFPAGTVLKFSKLFDVSPAPTSKSFVLDVTLQNENGEPVPSDKWAYTNGVLTASNLTPANDLYDVAFVAPRNKNSRWAWGCHNGGCNDNISHPSSATERQNTLTYLWNEEHMTNGLEVNIELSEDVYASSLNIIARSQYFNQQFSPLTTGIQTGVVASWDYEPTIILPDIAPGETSKDVLLNPSVGGTIAYKLNSEPSGGVSYKLNSHDLTSLVYIDEELAPPLQWSASASAYVACLMRWCHD